MFIGEIYMVKTYSDIQGFSLIPKDRFNEEFCHKQAIQEEIKKIQEKMISEVQRGFITVLNPKVETINIFKSAGFEISEEERFKVNAVTISWK